MDRYHAAGAAARHAAADAAKARAELRRRTTDAAAAHRVYVRDHRLLVQMVVASPEQGPVTSMQFLLTVRSAHDVMVGVGTMQQIGSNEASVVADAETSAVKMRETAASAQDAAAAAQAADQKAHEDPDAPRLYRRRHRRPAGLHQHAAGRCRTALFAGPTGRLHDRAGCWSPRLSASPPTAAGTVRPCALARRCCRRPVVQFALGFAWLAWFASLSNGTAGLGVEKAIAVGITPFIWGSILKTALVAFAVPATWALLQRRKS